jgi:hypothetical protein
MGVLDAIEFDFQLSDFFAIGIHLFASRVPVFVKLVNDQSRITINVETFYTEFDRNPHAVETGLVFCSIVRCREIDLEDVAELFIGWSNEEHACSYAIDVQGAIEIHLPVFDWPLIGRCAEVCPFGDKVD